MSILTYSSASFMMYVNIDIGYQKGNKDVGRSGGRSGEMNVESRVGSGASLRAPSRRSRVLLEITFVLGVLHLVDHVLRVDHSGWPFVGEVTPFTFFAVVSPPIALFAHFDRSRLWLRVGLLAFLLVGLLFAHAFLETPGNQSAVWATNASTEPYALGQPNLLDVESSVLGILAVGEAMLLNLFLLAAVVSLVADTWRARTSRAAREELRS